MGGFFDAAFGFPAVIFTVLLAPVVLYWLTVVVGALDIDLLGDVGDLGDAGDVGGLPADGPGSADPGAGGGLWQALGLAGVPITIAASLVVIFGWAVALVATAAADSLDVAPAVRLLGGVLALGLAVVVGARCAALAARPLAGLFVPTEAEGRSAFVGRTCTIRTSTVTTDFGQAEASDPSGATVLVPVRVSSAGGQVASSPLARGERALIFDYDPVAEVFLVCPVDDALEAGADGLS